MNRTKSTYLALVAVLLSPMTANAVPLYGGNGSLHLIDSSDGSSSIIDSGNSAYRLGLAYNGMTNTMYSLGLFDGCLSTVDLGTGATTTVGCSAFGATGLTFSGDFSTLYAFDRNGGPLIAIDPNNGSAVSIGPSDPGVLDLATDSSGAIFAGGFGGIFSIDPLTGAATSIGGALTWTAIAFDENDVLYGIDIGSDALYSIDQFTGVAMLIGGDVGSDVRGLAFAISLDVAVPEPGTLALLGLGLFGMGLARRKKKV